MAKRIITTENLEEDSKIEGQLNISGRRKLKRCLAFI